MLSRTSVAELYSATMMPRARNALPRSPVDAAEDGKVLNSLMTKAKIRFLEGATNKGPHLAESLQEGTKINMRTALHN